jgi:hypothetical protein
MSPLPGTIADGCQIGSDRSGLVQSSTLRASICSSTEDHACARAPKEISAIDSHDESVANTCLLPLGSVISSAATKPGSCSMMRPVGASR